MISTGHNFKVIEEEIEANFYAKKLIIGQDVQQFTSLTTEIIFFPDLIRNFFGSF